jgi:hypothetical protein
MWKMLLLLTIPMIALAGEQKKREDENETGKDDWTGLCLVFIADFLKAVINDKPLPAMPTALYAGQ